MNAVIRKNWLRIIPFSIFSSLAITATGAHATENGSGFYLLGQKGPTAAILPPPGVFFQNDIYLYDGNASASQKLPIAGEIAVNVRARVILDLPTVVWVTPAKVLGGKLGFAVTTPIGRPKIDANVVLGPISVSATDKVTAFGDPVASMMLGWNTDKFHVSLTSAVNIPIGKYDEGELANVSPHRWGGDFTLATTWLDPAVGLDISGALGVTFNGKNSATHYNSGNELHFEGAVVQHFSPQFSIGAIGYYYKQISDDKGVGARLGSFRGRVAALGGTAAYTFNIGKVPVTARAKILGEFSAKNRLQGTVGFLTLSMPLHVNGMN